jgi:hypothetical protein
VPGAVTPRCCQGDFAKLFPTAIAVPSVMMVPMRRTKANKPRCQRFASKSLSPWTTAAVIAVRT